MSNSAFTPSVLTISTGGAAATSGEKNYILSPDDNSASRWVASVSGITATTNTSVLPENSTKTTSIYFNRTSAPVNSYVRYRYRLDAADYSRLFKIQLNINTSDAAGAWQIQAFAYANADYSDASPVSLQVSTANIPSIVGPWLVSCAMPGVATQYIELRIVAVSGTSLYASGIIVGPGTIVQGAVVSEWQTVSGVTVSNLPTSAISAWYKREGSDAIIRIGGTLSGAGTGLIAFTVPSTLACESGIISIANLRFWGSARATKNGVGFHTGLIRFATSTAFYVTDDDGALEWNATIPFTWASADSFDLEVRYPVAAWSSSGTVNLGPGAQQEYASNGSTTAADDATQFVYGPAGSLIPTITGATGVPFTYFKRVSFSTAIQNDDLLTVEIQLGGAGLWIPIENIGDQYQSMRVDASSGNRWGIGLLQQAGVTTVDVMFGRAGRLNSGWAGGAGPNYPAGAADRWRVRKAKASSPVGFGLVSSANGAGLMPSITSQLDNATATQLGLKQYLHGTTYNGGNAPTLSAGANITTIGSIRRGVFIPYQTQDGTWRLRFNIRIDGATSASATTHTVQLAGVVFKNGTNVYQAFSGFHEVQTNECVTLPNAGSLSFLTIASTTPGNYTASGDVELESKPTWAY